MTDRLFSLAVAASALALLGVGAGLVTAPQRLGGPMGLALDLPLGAAALLLGVAAFEAMAAGKFRPGRETYAAVAAVTAGIAGWNFYRYPPIADGAYFLSRYGPSAGEWAPGPPAGALLAFAAAAWALDRASRRNPAAGGPIPLGIRLGGLLLWVILGCAGYGLFMDMLVHASTRDALVGVPLASLLIALPCHGLKLRYEGARSGFLVSLVTLALSLASWALYRH